MDWNSPDVQNTGYYYAMVKDVKVQCYDPPSGAKTSGSKAYIYNSAAGTNDTVEITNGNTVLKSLLGTGTNMSADYPHPVASGTNSAAAPAATSELATVPGLSGAGPGTNGQRGGGDSGTSGSASSGISSAPPPSDTGFHGFVQNGGSSTGTSTASPPKGERGLQGSLLAAVVAIVGMLVI